MDRDNELIEDSELCVKLDKGRVYHVKEIPDARTPIKHLEVEEVWQQVDSAGGQLLGKGSYGDVFKQECIQDVAGRKVGQLRAVKVVRKGAESTKAYYREELKAMAKFSMQKFRPYFVRSFGWYEAGNSIYITMECLEHGDLQRHLTRQFSERETCGIASQVVKGLECMHRNNFIHRDLKPENLLVVHKPPERDDWRVKICDFGISKRADDLVRGYWTVGIGTPKYMAPEVGLDEPRRKDQKRGKAPYTVKADMWSLGSICVRLITGDSAFHPTDLFRYYHDQGPFTPDAELASNGASQHCRDFVRAVMARDPEHRLSAEQASKHGWFTLNTPQRPRTPFEPVNPLPDQPEPKDEFEATAQWGSDEEDEEDEEDETENATIRPGAPTQQAFSLPAKTQHTENTSLAPTQQEFSPRVETQRTVTTPPKTTSPQPMEENAPLSSSPTQHSASPTQHYSDRRPAFRILGYPATDPLMQPLNQPAGHMDDSSPTTSQAAAAQHSGSNPYMDPYRSQNSGYSPGVIYGVNPLPPSQNRPAEYTAVAWPVIAQPYPAQHSGGPSGTDPYSATQRSGNTPNTNPHHTNQYLGNPPPAVGNHYPARSSTYPGGNPLPAPPTLSPWQTADGPWAQASNRGSPGNIFTVNRSMTAPSHAMSPNPNRVPDNSSFGNPSTGYQPAVSPSASHTGYGSPVSPPTTHPSYYQPYPSPSNPSYYQPATSQSTTQQPGYGSPMSQSASNPSYYQPTANPSTPTTQSGYGSLLSPPPPPHPRYQSPPPRPLPNTGGHYQPANQSPTTQQQFSYGPPISQSASNPSYYQPPTSPSTSTSTSTTQPAYGSPAYTLAAQRRGLHPVATPYGIIYCYD